MRTLSDTFGCSEILENAGLWNGRLLTHPSLPSTNQWMLAPPFPLQHGDVLRAIRQTAGHGRFRRPWKTPGARALTLSVFLHFETPSDWALRNLVRAAAIAVAETLDAFALEPGLKWPNDVWIGEKKIAGILAERDGENGPVILGIGLNINQTANDFSTDALRHPATSMALEAGHPFDLSSVLQRLLQRLESMLDSTAENNRKELEQRWQSRDILTGRTLGIETRTEHVEGAYKGLTSDGDLILLCNDNRERHFSSGDVSIRKDTV